MGIKHFGLFLLVSILEGPMILVGSVIGASAYGKVGLFVGAILGGILGVFLAAFIAPWCKVIAARDRWRTALGGIAGFVVAAAIGGTHLRTPIVPAISGLLIGAGAVAATLVRRN